MSVWDFFRRKPTAPVLPDPDREPGAGLFSTHGLQMSPAKVRANLDGQQKRFFDGWRKATDPDAGLAMDDSGTGTGMLKATLNSGEPVSALLAEWYTSTGFIGYQLCATVARNWLVNKACTIPARDAVRHGFEIVVKGDDARKTEIVEKIAEADRKLKLAANEVEFIRMGRVFGIRVAFFVIDTDDPDEFYANPFNIDGVKPGAYRGISQVDPYWMAPVLDAEASSDAASQHFFEPTWWVIQGRKYHRSHLMIFRHCEVADILKPSYIYGGISVPEQIMERVYAAERTANEGPMLAMTKRTIIWQTDLETIAMNQEKFAEHMQAWSVFRDNYGVKMMGLEDKASQFDTALGDVDTVTMTQYQLVAAASNVPVTKLLGTSPKGFSATGEYDEASYHEELESVQENDLSPLVRRHHELVWRSLVQPEFFDDIDVSTISIEHDWHPVDSPTAKEYAEINKLNADTDAVLVTAGAIDGDDVRKRLDNDKNSGYAGIIEAAEIIPPEEVAAAEATVAAAIAEAASITGA